MEQFKAIFKIAVISLLILVSTQCNDPKFQGVGVPVTPSPQPQPNPVALSACQFYKAQSLILNCHEKHNFFTQAIQKQKNVIASICAKRAFSTVWGAYFNPSPYVYDAESVKNTNFHWSFGFGNIQKGSPSAFPPNSLELKYLHLLNQFKNSLDANQMNQCLGGNYPYDGPTIIKTSFKMIKLKFLEPETFILCYREQLERYRAQKACSL